MLGGEEDEKLVAVTVETLAGQSAKILVRAEDSPALLYTNTSQALGIPAVLMQLCRDGTLIPDQLDGTLGAFGVTGHAALQCIRRDSLDVADIAFTVADASQAKQNVDVKQWPAYDDVDALLEAATAAPRIGRWSSSTVLSFTTPAAMRFQCEGSSLHVHTLVFVIRVPFEQRCAAGTWAFIFDMRPAAQAWLYGPGRSDMIGSDIDYISVNGVEQHRSEFDWTEAELKIFSGKPVVITLTLSRPTSASHLHLMQRHTGNEQANGDIAELLLFKGSLEGDRKRELERHLMQKWSIPIVEDVSIDSPVMTFVAADACDADAADASILQWPSRENAEVLFAAAGNPPSAGQWSSSSVFSFASPAAMRFQSKDSTCKVHTLMFVVRAPFEQRCATGTWAFIFDMRPAAQAWLYGPGRSDMIGSDIDYISVNGVEQHRSELDWKEAELKIFSGKPVVITLTLSQPTSASHLHLMQRHTGSEQANGDIAELLLFKDSIKQDRRRELEECLMQK